MTELAQRIASLSPAQREMLLRELARAGAGAAPGPDLSLPPLVPRPEERFEPFPLTDVQEVYWVGRSGLFDLGTPGVNVYLEYDIPATPAYLDPMERGLRRLCEQHSVLRLVVLPDGRQQVREEMPPVRIERADLRGLPPAEVDAALAAAGERVRHHGGAPGQWPLFGAFAQILDGPRIRLYVWFDAWLIDGMSREILMRDLQRLVANPEAVLPPPPCTFRDYALSWEAIRESEAFRRARDWWLERIPSLPPAPELPLAVPLEPHVRARFAHSVDPLLDPAAWACFRENAGRKSLTAAPALLAAFVEVIRAWSRQPRFSIALVGTYYPPVHPGLPEIVGNFNTIYIAAADAPRGVFRERAKRLQDQVTDLLDHRVFSGFQVLREIRRQRGGGTHPLMPIHFNNLVEHQHAAAAPQRSDQPPAGTVYASADSYEVDRGINPPQILLMPSVYESHAGGLGCRLQWVEGVFPPGLIQDLWGAYADLLARLADDETLWDSPHLRLTPQAHLDARAAEEHVLDAELEPRPDWVVGDLWLSGPGLDHGDGLTHPRTGERLFRTGQLARFLPGGTLEIVEREESSEPPLPVSGEPAAPEPLEEEIGQLAGQILGTAPLLPGDDFFAHGGTSFTAVLLLNRVQERWGDERDLTPFLSEPTPRSLARLVRSGPLRQTAAASTADTSEDLLRRARAERVERSPVRRLRGALAGLRGRLLPDRASLDSGMRLYLLLWLSQFVSGIGTGLGSFALGVWVYRQNASTTQFAMTAFLATCTALIVGPIAGVLADRWDRRRLILLGDCGAAVMTGLMALALYTDQMRLWYVYIIVVCMVGFSTLQGPAFTATVSLLVPRRHLGRASGMAQAAGIATGIICPPLAGALVPVIDYHGVILIDIVTFLFAFVVLLSVRLPQPPASEEGPRRRSLTADFLFGWTWLRQRPGLFTLLLLFAAINFSSSMVQVLMTPLVLGFGSAAGLGAVQSAAAAGGLIGSLALTLWGGPRSRVVGVLLFLLLKGPILLLGALQPSVALIAVAAFLYMGLTPISRGLSQVIWQSKVAHDVQGRVFAMSGLVAASMSPLAFLLAGPLADGVFKPLLVEGGPLADTAVGQLIGVGPGRGVGLMFMCLGLLIVAAVLLAYLNPRLRRIEAEVPDA